MFVERKEMKEDIFALALETLERRKSEIEKEIAEIHAELNGASPKANESRSERMKSYWAEKRAISTAKPAAKPRKRTAAEKKLISQKLKASWAKRKAAVVKK
jgi:hypothetical protein